MAPDRVLALKIKRARERKGLTQQQLAELIGRSRKTVDNWENARTLPKSSLGAIEAVLGSLDLPPPDPREEELRSFSESQGGVLPDAEVKEWIDRYRAQRDKQRAG